MSGAPAFRPPLQGILKCRDLVTLYYGFPMLVAINDFSLNTVLNTPTQLLAPSPARIKYEIQIVNTDPASQFCLVGSQKAVDGGDAPTYVIPAGSTFVIERDFLTDLDGVSDAVWYQANSSNLNFSARETLLTPPSVEQLPQG